MNSQLTVECKCCSKKFTVPHQSKEKLYCCESCEPKSHEIKKSSICVVCNKDFKHHGEKVVCEECNPKYVSSFKFGENDPSQTENKKLVKCSGCGKDFLYAASVTGDNHNRCFCSLMCSHKINVCDSFGQNDVKSESIFKINPVNKENGCIICGSDGSDNLCQKCSGIVNCDPMFWGIVFSGINSGSKLVKKAWGLEVHIANHNQYCLKYLIFFKDRQFSFHSHVLKKELWHCICGEFECVLELNGKKEYFIFKQGDKIELEAGVVHQLQAVKNSILVEVSTRDYPEDSIRLIDGIN